MKDDGTFTNNSEYPLILYQQPFQRSEQEATKAIKQVDGQIFGRGVSIRFIIITRPLGNCCHLFPAMRRSNSKSEIGRFDLGATRICAQTSDSLGRFYFTRIVSVASSYRYFARGSDGGAQRKSISECQAPSKNPVFGMDLAPFYE